MFAKFNRVAVLYMTKFAKRDFFHFGCIWPNTPKAFDPITIFNGRFVFKRVGTIDNVVLRRRLSGLLTGLKPLEPRARLENWTFRFRFR